MKLVNLKLKNFQGVKDLTLNTQGGNVAIYGNNATGKTTIFNAFTWLLFDKDSHNKKDFDIKTLDSSGEAQHGIEHEVEGVFDPGKGVFELVLRKVYQEKWTKKRGSPKETFTGHTTDYFVDGVPVKKAEYEAKVESLIKEDTFKLLTSPTYFNEQFHWQDRRQILLDVCGDITDEDVISSAKKLAKLPEILGPRTLDDHRKVVAERRKLINKKLEEIPNRIDEVELGLSDVSGLDKDQLSGMVISLKGKRAQQEKKRVRIQAGGEVAEKTKALREVEAKLLELKNKAREMADTGIDDKRKEHTKAKISGADFSTEAMSLENRRKANLKEIDRLETQAESFRDKWRKENDREFAFEQDENCPTCGQKLPKSDLEAARENAKAGFNKVKAENLEEIDAAGKAVKNRITNLNDENADLDKQITEAEKKRSDAQALIEKLDGELAKLRDESNVSYEISPDYKEAVKEKEVLETAIAELKRENNGAIAAVEQKIGGIEGGIEKAEQDLAKFEQRKSGEARIEELKAEEKKLAAEFEELEGELFLTDEFIRAKVNLLEDKINSKFDHARFKLFEEQVNGGITEVCETTYQGVPYGSSLNNGARITVGLDIIQTLAEHYGFTAPVFIDNAEAITELPAIESQMITLYVSEKDKELRVVPELEKVKEAV